MLDKAKSEAQKRIIKKTNEVKKQSIDKTDHLLPNKEAAHKNMQPKAMYLLGSPDDSDESEDEDEVEVKGVQSKYLL